MTDNFNNDATKLNAAKQPNVNSVGNGFTQADVDRNIPVAQISLENILNVLDDDCIQEIF